MKILMFGDTVEDFGSYSIVANQIINVLKEKHELYLITLSGSNIIDKGTHIELPVIRTCGGRETPSTSFTFTDNIYLYSK